MGSAILQGADKRTAHKFARIMIHEPSMWSGGNSKKLRQDADLLDTVKEDLAELYAESCGKEKEWILDNWMKPDEDTWFNATKAKQNGLLDEVTSSNVEAPKSSMDFGQMAAHYDKQFYNETNQKHMTQAELAKKIGLPENATMEEIEAKVAELEKAGKGDGDDTPEANAEKKLVSAAMALGKAKGIIDASNEAKMKARFEKDPQNAIEWMEDLPAATAKKETEAPKGGELSALLAELKEKREPSATDGSKKKFSELTEDELEAMEKNNPKQLDALFKAEYPDSNNPKED